MYFVFYHLKTDTYVGPLFTQISEGNATQRLSANNSFMTPDPFAKIFKPGYFRRVNSTLEGSEKYNKRKKCAIKGNKLIRA